jgi:putative phosphonate catabolism associated alcohol dehydrogenase
MTGRAAVFTEVGKPLAIREYPVPDVAHDAMLVKIHRANVCGSDLHFMSGRGPGVKSGPPRVMGHEMVGHIEKLGSSVTTDSLGQPLREGDRVVYSYYSPCGTCIACLNDLPACPNRYRYWLGASCDEPPHFNGAYADYYYLRSGHWIFKVPDELSDDLVSPVNCALAEVVYGLSAAGITLEDAVVLQGAGGLGLYAAAVARTMGAGQVIVVDRRADRLSLAKEFGADVVLDASQTDAAQRVQSVKELTRGNGADLVAEFTGSTAVLEEGIEMLRAGGRYLWVGNINLGVEATIQPGQVVRNQRTIHSVIAYKRWVLPRALDFLRRNKEKFPFEKIISHQFPLAQINDALAFAATGQAMRVTVVP